MGNVCRRAIEDFIIFMDKAAVRLLQVSETGFRPS